MVPWVNGMKEPMWETGTERFNNMPEEGQREMMGNNYYDAWKRGDFQLKDMVQMHHSPTWGDSPGLVPLGKLSPNWKSYAAGKAQQPAAAVTQAANLFANPLSLKDRQYYKDLFEDLRFEGTGMAERQLKQNAAAIMNLSDSDKKAFRNYTGSGYHDMNAALRKGATMNWSDLKLDNELSDIFPNLPPTQGAFVTRRGCGDWSPTAVVGDRIVDPAYMSTSISMPFGGNKFEIVVPAGSKNVAYIPKISIFDNEKELLFNKNGIFEVLDIIHESDGYNTYRLLYIGNLGD